MHLTPDDIASRSFTPSVDGYHQGEVRSFLERVAGQIRALQAALPEGQPELAQLTAAVQDREPRLAELERKLGELVADLAAATDRIHEVRSGVGAGVVAAPASSIDSSGVNSGDAAAASAEQQRLATELQAERQALTELQASLREQHETLVAQQQALSEHQQAFLAKQENFEEQQRAFVASQQALEEQQRAFVASQQALEEQQHGFVASQQALAEQQQSLSEQQERLGEHLDDTRRLAGTPASPTPSPSDELPSVIPRSLGSPASTSRPNSSVAAAAAEAELLSIFASDLDDQPLFSDSANDLLDGVLDDVMGDITEEGTTP